MVKKKFLFLNFCLVLAMSLTLTACGGTNKKNALASQQNVYGLGAVSTVKLLDSSISAKAIRSFSSLNAMANIDVETSTEVEMKRDKAKEQVEKFNEYFSALNGFLGEDIVSTTTSDNTDAQYAFQKKMVIKGKNINGVDVLHTMYYTETLESNSVEQEEDEVENKYVLSGVMIVDNNEYYLEGERSEEREQNETEAELKIRAYANKANKNSFIQMEQETSVEAGEKEVEYVYSVYFNGLLVEQTSVDFEVENKNNKVETEFELKFRSGSAKGRYVVKREVKDNLAKIKVSYNIDGEAGEFQIREVVDSNGNKQYEYSFSDGSTQMCEVDD